VLSVVKGFDWNLLMKRLASFLAFCLLSSILRPLEAVEILRWQRLPLAVPLVVGQEHVIFVDRNVRVGVPASVGNRLRVQSAGGAVYLRANEPIPLARIELRDVESGTVILLDIAAEPARAGDAPLEPVRIVEEGTEGVFEDFKDLKDTGSPKRRTPVPVALVRHAAQNLYAPLRTIEPVAGIGRVTLQPGLALETLLPALPVRAQALAAWRLEDHWVTAVRLSNVSALRLDLDPRALQGDFVAASFQHPHLGPAGESTDTTVVYLVTRGHGLAGSLWPRVSPIDAAVNLPPPERSHAK
jgi:integrating conjugative element protein (TIGR03749 family)